MIILVAGATGLLGAEICLRLRKRGIDVRALARPTANPARVAQLRDAGAELVWGDLKDPESLRDAWPELGLQVNLGGGSFKTQFKRADKSGAQFAILLGDDEMARGVVGVKALRQELAQEECPIDRISERLGVLLGLKGG